VERLAIVARLKSGAEPRAAALLAKGPPFDPRVEGLDAHTVYLSASEVMFVFEGRDVGSVVDDMIENPLRPELTDAFEAWRPLLVGQPRIARAAYVWERRDVS
jgi:hypothetical protein